MNDDDFVTVVLHREDYEVLKELIKEREAYNFLIAKLKNLWVWTVVGGLISITVFWESIKPFFIKV